MKTKKEVGNLSDEDYFKYIKDEVQPFIVRLTSRSYAEEMKKVANSYVELLKAIDGFSKINNEHSEIIEDLGIQEYEVYNDNFEELRQDYPECNKYVSSLTRRILEVMEHAEYYSMNDDMKAEMRSRLEVVHLDDLDWKNIIVLEKVCRVYYEIIVGEIR